MYFDDTVLHAVNCALDDDTPIELLPMVVTRHAGLLAGVPADHLGGQLWG